MAYCFPTSEDTALLVAFVHQSADQLKSSDVHRLRQAEVDDDDNVIASVSRSEDDDGDLSEVLKCTCDAIVATTEESSKFFGSPDAGPVVSPSQFAQSTIGHLVQLNAKAKQLQKQLLAEGREHGLSFAPLSFAPDATKNAYGKFSDAIHAVVQWTTSALKFAEGRGDRDGRPVGHGENVHDVVPLYAAFYENSQLYFLQECTLFDPRIQRRILMPAYFHALRDHILSLRKEIDRLLSVDEVLQRSTVGAARFHPPIQDFSFLLESLQFYLAVSVVEDDLTTVTYYRILYDAVKRETQAVAERLAQLPNDANSSSPSPSSSAAATVADTTPRTGDAFRSGPLSSPSSTATATGGVPSSPLRATPSPHEQCSAAFAAFDEVRHRVLELQSNIKKDIDAKNQTHKTRAAGVTLAKQQQGGPSSPSVAVAAAALHQQAAASSAGWWSSIKSASSRLLCGAADVVTCRAEIFPTETDADGVPLSATSPLASKKLELLERVNLLVAAVEAIADGLEAQYPNVYHRDFFSRLQKSANRVIQHLESMTVVFKGSF
ncbi:Hypothetical protein, putative [Bodo saltans]|uniref:Uncharacterized protein n=1 Tax=Bodo saltans TaxID=75058 RepID=A0A0S4JIN6_BODSA|nr:Hypothetical protein, putative [Bodo saltans]|eukprot:CUG91375.1 Hypothetical protein, putative [Bodo saltans]